MQTVNEIVFGQKLLERSLEQNTVFYESISKVLNDCETEERIRDDYKRILEARIRNVGEKGALELLGSLAVYFTQIPEKQVRGVEVERAMRRGKRNNYIELDAQ